ncbi:hypothetical protein F441_07891 [Phytophthora nicotianae CJ01A1]|uniref:NADH:flavin oxidoreductase/NADH oxidase N-terminal domain-containing protein n=3 Tax=Phytophthora nicotianae TaxID=4792 RepID=W2KIT8_PHYNI|nr:hypothetical protein L915_12031 [Phytophthora nicotianae]ETL84260.1 hypothetical protein L917_15882 [Phytophthora nicotianae]ETP17765.1 hypothetical protein F441_07891 [Phytophthora nicotianae CJ01A1]
MTRPATRTEHQNLGRQRDPLCQKLHRRLQTLHAAGAQQGLRAQDPHRVQRARSDPETHVPLGATSCTTSRCVGARLLIKEGGISDQGFGCYGAPALYTDEQEAKWMELADPGHQDRSVVVAHGPDPGRRGDVPPVRHSAKRVGFDGVKVHGANGYLMDLSLQPVPNHCAEKYGGSFESRFRFLHEIVKAGVPGRSHICHLTVSSVAWQQGQRRKFMHAFERQSQNRLGYLAMLDEFGFVFSTEGRTLIVFDANKAFKGNVIVNNSYTCDTDKGVVRSGAVDFVGFDRLFMSNTALAEHFQND